MCASNAFSRPDAISGTTKGHAKRLPKIAGTLGNSGGPADLTERPSRGNKTSYPLPPDRSSLGARPRRPKNNRSLSNAQVEAMIEGGLYAQRIGYPLNRFITIDWDRAGVIDLWEAQSAFIKYVRDWLRRHEAGPATYAWVIENGPRHGLHSHIMLHVPPALIKAFSKRQFRWWKKVGIDLHIKGVLHSKHIGHSYWAGFDQGTGVMAYRQNLAQLTNYLAKAAAPEVRRAHNITRPPQYSDVPGRRAGTSLNISPKTITKWRQANLRERRSGGGQEVG